MLIYFLSYIKDYIPIYLQKLKFIPHNIIDVCIYTLNKIHNNNYVNLMVD